MKTKTMARKFLTVFAVVVFAVSLISVGSVSAEPKKYLYPPIPSWWTGHNSMLDDYYVAPGYPSYDPHPRYLGELSGSWHQIGKQYGEKAGDLIRMVFEGWYRQHRPKYEDLETMLDYIHKTEAYLETLAPEALELMKGIAVGAKKELDMSVYADLMTHYEKILLINSYFQLSVPLPGGGAGDEPEGCSGAVILRKGTKDGKIIHVSSEDQSFFPQEYLVTYFVNPSDRKAQRYTVTDSAGEIGSQTAINDKGVVVSGYAGGGRDVVVKPGLDWQVGVWFATAFSNTAEEAVDLLTVGTPEYRKKTGNKIVIGRCGRGVNWVVSDLKEAYVVESIPGDLNGVARYAVRVPGDLGEIGDYVVSTNTVEADYSCNEDNVCDKTHPMRQHGNATQGATYFGLSGSGMRHWTLMCLIKNNYGNINREMVQEWRKTHYIYDSTCTKHDFISVPNYGNVSPHLTPGVGTMCRHTTSGPPDFFDTFTGINIYVSIGVPEDLAVYRTKGRPCEWVGDWDVLSLYNIP